MDLDNCTDETTIYLNETDFASLYLYTFSDRIVTFYVIPLISVFGILCNITFIIVVARVPFMRNATTCYLVQLAVADILMLFATTVEKISLMSLTPVRYDVAPVGFIFGCIIMHTFVDMPYFSSLFFITLVTYDRYVAICRPLRLRLHTTSLRRAKLSVTSWIIAMAGSLFMVSASYEVLCVVPPDADDSAEYFPTKAMSCGSNALPDWLFLLQSVSQTLLFIATLIFNGVMYVAILRAIRIRERQEGIGDSRQRRERMVHSRRSVDKMVLVTGGLFFLLLSPLECFIVGATVGDITNIQLLTYEQQDTLLLIFRLLSYMNSAINPLVYNVTNSRYRTAFKTAFWCRREKNAINKGIELNKKASQ